MNSLTIDKKQKRIYIDDNNKKLVYLIRFVFGLNVLNSIFFFAIFNFQEDVLKWLWLVFAVLSIVVLYLSLTKLSLANDLGFDEIDEIQAHSVFGLNFKLKNGKFRKIFMARESDEAARLIKLFD